MKKATRGRVALFPDCLAGLLNHSPSSSCVTYIPRDGCALRESQRRDAALPRLTARKATEVKDVAVPRLYVWILFRHAPPSLEWVLAPPGTTPLPACRPFVGLSRAGTAT